MTTGYSGKHATYYNPPQSLADRMADAIAAIPASNPTLGDLLDRDMIRKIAEVAAAVAKE